MKSKIIIIYFVIFLSLIFHIVLGQRKGQDKLGYNAQRKLEYSSYITIIFGKKDISYENGFSQYNSISRNEISYIIYEGGNYTKDQNLNIHAGNPVYIYFSYPIKSLENFFNGGKDTFVKNNLQTVDFSNFDSSSLENIRNLFYYCSYVQEINFKKFDTSKVVNMENMFYYCGMLKSIDLSSSRH